MLAALAPRALSLTLGSAWIAATPIIVAPPPNATGVCPTAADVETSLALRFPGSVRPSSAEAAPGQLRLSTALVPSGLRLELRNERGDVLLKRLLPREGREEDCRALAESIALIVDRYVRALIPEGANAAVDKNATPSPPVAPPRPAAAAPAVAPTPPPTVVAPSPAPAPAEPAAPVPERSPTPRAAEPPREEAPPPVAPTRPATKPTPAQAERAKAEAPGAEGGSAHVLAIHGGGRIGDGVPKGSWEGRVSLQRVSATPAQGWVLEAQTGFGSGGTMGTDRGSLRLDRIPVRLGFGRSFPLGFGQLETTLGAGGDFLVRSFTPSNAAPSSRDWTFAPIIDWQGGFRALVSERVSLLLSVNVGYALRRYDVGLATSVEDRTPVAETPRFTVTPLLGLGLRLW